MSNSGLMRSATRLSFLSCLAAFLLNISPCYAETPVDKPHENTLETLYPDGFFPIVKKLCENKPSAALKISAKQRKKSVQRQESLLDFFSGVSLLRLKRYPEAASALQSSWKLRKSSSDTLYFLATALFQIDEKERAYQLLKEAAWFGRHQIVPPETIHERLAVILIENEQLEEAKKELDLSISKNPHYVPARMQLASLYDSLGDATAAQNQMTHAKEILERKTSEKTTEDEGCTMNNLRSYLLGSKRSPLDAQLLNARYALSQATAPQNRSKAKDTIQDLQSLLKSEEISPTQTAEAEALLGRAFLLERDVESAKASIDRLEALSPSHPALQGLKDSLQTEMTAKEQELALEGELEPAAL